MTKTDIRIIKDGDTQCSHNWEEDFVVIDILPPIHTQRCRMCRRIEGYSYKEDIELQEALNALPDGTKITLPNGWFQLVGECRMKPHQMLEGSKDN